MLTGVSTRLVKTKNDEHQCVVLKFEGNAESVLPALGSAGLAIRDPDTRHVGLCHSVEAVVSVGIPESKNELTVGRENDDRAVFQMTDLIQHDTGYTVKYQLQCMFGVPIWAWAGQRFQHDCELQVRKFQPDLPFAEESKDK